MIARVTPSQLADTDVIDAIPGDKSISHRAVMMAGLATGRSEFSRFLLSEDCLNTITIFREMGVEISVDEFQARIVIQGRGIDGLRKPVAPLFVGNSGTTIRLMSGILAGLPFDTTIQGDASILRRPMRRVVDPLTQMGAHITGQPGQFLNDIYPPLIISPVSHLSGIRYSLPVASAQVKSALLFAGLLGRGTTTIDEPTPTRDHTENMMRKYGIAIKKNGSQIEIVGGQNPIAPISPVEIPADFSSAAFFMVLALITPNVSWTMQSIGVNPTRDRLVAVLQSMGAQILVRKSSDDGEPRAAVTVASSNLTNIDVAPDDIPIMIDEIPILAIAGMFGQGQLRISHAGELRVKESDRIAGIVRMITAMGGTILESSDGFILEGGRGIQPFQLDCHHDHRIAMAAIIGAVAGGVDATVENVDCIATSFPNFFDILRQVGGKVAVV